MRGVTVEIRTRSKLGAPAVLAVDGHPEVGSIVVSRDLGDAGSRVPGLHGVPCLLLNLASEEATALILGRLRTLSARLYRREAPRQIACDGGVAYTLRIVHGFDEAAIALVEQCHAEAQGCYEAAQRAYLQGGASSLDARDRRRAR